MWIEIGSFGSGVADINVTPYAGVWIEIEEERLNNAVMVVTPYAGVWIEIQTSKHARQGMVCHSLRGSVD